MATVIAAIAILSLLTFVHELGHLLLARRSGIEVDEFGLGFPPRLLTLGHYGKTELTLNLIPFGAFLRLAEQGSANRLLAGQSKRTRAAFLLGGPALNLLLACMLFTACYATGWPFAYDRAVGVAEIASGSVAEAVGFQTGDLILSADGHRVLSVLDLIVYARSAHGDIRTVTVRRSGRTFDLSLPSGRPWFVNPTARGIRLHNDAGWIETIRYPIPQALYHAAKSTTLSALTIFALPIRVVLGSVPLDLVRPVGPIGIAQLAGQVVHQTAGGGLWFPLLHLTATLSTALAATNLLPLPGFDGGRLLFIAIEGLRGKRMTFAHENLVHWVGLVLIILAIFLVSYYDIVAPYPWGP